MLFSDPIQFLLSPSERREPSHGKNAALLLLSFYIIPQVAHSLFAEYFLRKLSIDASHTGAESVLLVFWEDILRLLIIGLLALKNTESLDLTRIVTLVPMACAEWLFRNLFYQAIKGTSSSLLTLLLTFQAPFVYQLILRKEMTKGHLIALLLILTGGLVSQIGLESISFTKTPHLDLLVAFMSLQPGLIYWLNKNMTQPLNLSLLSAQLNQGLVSLLLSCMSFPFIGKSMENVKVGSLMSMSVLGCIVSGAVWCFAWAHFKYENLVAAQSFVTLFIAIFNYFISGSLPFQWSSFVIGMAFLFAGSMLYPKTVKAGLPNWADRDSDDDGSPSKIKPPKKTQLAKLLVGATGLLFVFMIQFSVSQTSTAVGVHTPEHKPSLLGKTGSFMSSFYGKETDEQRLLSAFKQAPLSVIAYASEAQDGLCRTIRSTQNQNLTLFVMGYGQRGAISEKPHQFIKVSTWVSDQIKKGKLPSHQVLVFMDSFDMISQRGQDYILKEFNALNTDIVYSSEKNCWPFVQDKEAEAAVCPKFKANQDEEKLKELYKEGENGGKHTVYLNAGWMACRAQSCAQWFTDNLSLKTKYFPEDDQGLATLTCIDYGPKRCALDKYSKLAQSMLWSREDMEFSKSEDMMEISEGNGGKWKNKRTSTVPAFIHFNGDKSHHTPMDDELYRSFIESKKEFFQKEKEKNALQPVVLPWEKRHVYLVDIDKTNKTVKMHAAPFHELCSKWRWG